MKKENKFSQYDIMRENNAEVGDTICLNGVDGLLFQPFQFGPITVRPVPTIKSLSKDKLIELALLKEQFYEYVIKGSKRYHMNIYIKDIIKFYQRVILTEKAYVI